MEVATFFLNRDFVKFDVLDLFDKKIFTQTVSSIIFACGTQSIPQKLLFRVHYENIVNFISQCIWLQWYSPFKNVQLLNGSLLKSDAAEWAPGLPVIHD